MIYDHSCLWKNTIQWCLVQKQVQLINKGDVANSTWILRIQDPWTLFGNAAEPSLVLSLLTRWSCFWEPQWTLSKAFQSSRAPLEIRESRLPVGASLVFMGLGALMWRNIGSLDVLRAFQSMPLILPAPPTSEIRAAFNALIPGARIQWGF